MPLAALLLPMVVAQGPKLVVPTATWEPIFSLAIDQRAKWTNLPPGSPYIDYPLSVKELPI